MAQQKMQRRFHDDKPVPWSGRKRVKKKRNTRPETIPDGWSWAMMIRHIDNTRGV